MHLTFYAILISSFRGHHPTDFPDTRVRVFWQAVCNVLHCPVHFFGSLSVSLLIWPFFHPQSAGYLSFSGFFKAFVIFLSSWPFLPVSILLKLMPLTHTSRPAMNRAPARNLFPTPHKSMWEGSTGWRRSATRACPTTSLSVVLATPIVPPFLPSFLPLAPDFQWKRWVF